MHIVDVNEFYSPTGGGVRTYVDRKMTLMAEMGHRLTVIAPGRRDWVDDRPGGRVIYVKAPGMPFDANYGLFWEAAPIHALLDQLAPDVVEASSPWRPAWIVGKWPGSVPRVFFMHNDNVAAYPMRWFEPFADPGRIERAFAWYSRYMNRFLDLYDAVLTNGPALQKRLSARGVRIDAAMTLGIEGAHFSPMLRDDALRASLLAECGLGPDARLLLGIGRFHPEKRWPLVIEAVRAASRARPIGLMVIGDGIERRRIARLAADSPHIRLRQPMYDRSALAAIMASSDALIHASEAEPFGLVASEAMASGLPLIVPDTGGCAEVADRRCAELYRARDAGEAALAIGRLFDRDPALLRRVASVTAMRVRTDVEHVRELMAYYETLVTRGIRVAA